MVKLLLSLEEYLIKNLKNCNLQFEFQISRIAKWFVFFEKISRIAKWFAFFEKISRIAKWFAILEI